MLALLRTVRFYRVVTPVPPLMLAAFGIVTAAAVAALAWSPAGASRAAVPVLVLQAFAVSTGFATSARRGHYDPLLTGGTGRVQAAVMHWAMSALPGVSSCLVVLGVAAVADDGARPVSVPGTVAALVLVSTLPWAAGVRLPRFAGAIGWLLVAVTARSLTTGATLLDWPALGFLLMPVDAAAADPAALRVGPGLAVAAAAMGAALFWIASADLPLDASQ